MVLFAGQCEFLIFLIHVDITTTGYTACTHTTCNYGSVACHTTTNSQDTLRCFHTSDIFRRSLKTYKYDFLASLIPLYSILCCKYDFTTSSSRRSTKCFTDWSSSFQFCCIKLWVKKCIQVTRIDHCYCFFFCLMSFINEVTSNLQSSRSGSLTVTALKHVKFFVLYSKLHILHIMVVILKDITYFDKFSICFWEFLLHLSDWHWCTNTGNYVLALCVLKELTHQFILACSRVTSEGNTCTGLIIQVTEYHRHYVNCCSP